MTLPVYRTAEGRLVVGDRQPDGSVEIGERCTHCGASTALGHGRFVNRVPSSADGTDFDGAPVELVGYLCADCQPAECDLCGTVVPDASGPCPACETEAAA